MRPFSFADQKRGARSAARPVRPQRRAGSAHLRSRGFDLDELASQFHVGYCEYAATQPTLFDRIVIPVYRPRSGRISRA